MSEARERRAIAEARVGRRMGRDLCLRRLLGVGGMAAVYEATDRAGRRVAVKVLHPSLSRSRRQRKRFVREAYVARSIAHPGVVEIYGDGVEGGEAYLVMELLEGETVAALARRNGGKLEFERALEIADELLGALAAAHARGVIHRDIKPENLFVLASGRLKVLDFGVARLFEALPGLTVDTQAGVTLGTPGFMAQEQARGRWDEVDQRSDLWAVGATLFTLVTGRHVHEGETPNEQLGRAMTVPAPSLGVLAPHLPPAFVAAVDRALRFEPEQRWQDARSMQAALRRVRDGAAEALLDVDVAAGAHVAQGDAITDPASLAPLHEQETSGLLRAIRAAGFALGLAVAAVVLWRAAIEVARADMTHTAGPSSRERRPRDAVPAARTDAAPAIAAPVRSPAAAQASSPTARAALPSPPRPAPPRRGTESRKTVDLLDVRY